MRGLHGVYGFGPVVQVGASQPMRSVGSSSGTYAPVYSSTPEMSTSVVPYSRYAQSEGTGSSGSSGSGSSSGWAPKIGQLLGRGRKPKTTTTSTGSSRYTVGPARQSMGPARPGGALFTGAGKGLSRAPTRVQTIPRQVQVPRAPAITGSGVSSVVTGGSTGGGTGLSSSIWNPFQTNTAALQGGGSRVMAADGELVVEGEEADRPWWHYAAAAALVGGLGYAGWRYYKRSARSKAAA